MKILIVLTPPFDPTTGGVQMSSFKMASYFASQGLKVTIYSFQKNGHISQEFSKLLYSPEEGGCREINNLAHFTDKLKEIQADIIINQMPYEYTIGERLLAFKSEKNFLLLGCLRNTLFSVKLNLDSYRKKVIPKSLQVLFNNPLGRFILLQKHKSRHKKDLIKIMDTYDYFVLFGQPNIKELQYFIGDYKKEKIALIPNSIPKVVDTVPNKEKLILWLSRLSYGQKRAELILPIWKLIYNQLPDWRLEIVGNGDAYTDIAKQIEEEQIPRVFIQGKQAADAYFEKSPIYFMTSAFEGFPNTVIEAQSYGAVPVIFNNYPMAEAVINNCIDGFLIPPFNLIDMANSIIKLAQNEVLISTMADAALINANQYTIDKIGQQWLMFFRENSQYFD